MSAKKLKATDCYSHQFNQNTITELPRSISASLDPVLQRVVLSAGAKNALPSDTEATIAPLEGIKNRLLAPFESINGPLVPLQEALMAHIGTYRDVFYFNTAEDVVNDGISILIVEESNIAAVDANNDPITEKDVEKLNEFGSLHLIKGQNGHIRRLLCLHALNHVYKTRDLVLKNNDKLKGVAAVEESSSDEEVEVDQVEQKEKKNMTLMELKEESLKKDRKEKLKVNIKATKETNSNKKNLKDGKNNKNSYNNNQKNKNSKEGKNAKSDASKNTKDYILKNDNSKKRINLNEIQNDCEARDQGFTRAKVLILAPFRSIAYDFVTDLIRISGSVQQDNKTRFVDEFGPGDDTPDARKPSDFNQTFRGNIDDCFKMGLKFSRKQLKLFSNFAQSDIIVASPLGLKLIIEKEFDFLSSIEIVIAMDSHIFHMQNWDHLKSVFEHLNKIPTHAKCDFSRVKNYILDGQANLVRQTLIFSAFQTPELNALSSSCQNLTGHVKITHEVTGSIVNVVNSIPLHFTRIPSCQLPDLHDFRFNNFTSKILPTLIHKTRILIMIPSYFDFVRVRNHMQQHNYSFESISEYTPKPEVDRARHAFNTSEVQILLYTERTHFYRRYKMKCNHLVLYAPLVNAHLFGELVSGAVEDVGVYWSLFDKIGVEGIVGTKRVKAMMGERIEYMFSV